MKFRKISERVRGGKLDPLSKMGKSKLTGQEVAKYYKDNPKAKMAAKDKTVKKAIELALDLGGNYTLASKEIEKLKRGLSKMPVVQQALKTANEDMTSTTSVAMPDGIPLGKVKKTKVLKRKDLEEQTLVEKKVRYQTDFGKDRMGVTATAFAEYTKHIAKKFKIKIVKTPNPKSQNHLTFEAPEKDMKKFQQFLKKNLVKNAVPYIQKKNAGKLDESLDKSVKLSRPAKGQRTLTIDFSKARNPKKAKDKTMSIAKKHNIKTGKPKKPKSKDDVEFTGSKKAMTLFGREFNLAGRTGLLEGKAENKKAQIERIQLMRKVKATTRGQKTALADLLAMTSPKVLESMFKQNPRGFMVMLSKMNTNNQKLSKADYMVDGQFVAPGGSLLTKDQTNKLSNTNESTELNEEVMLYRIKDIQKPELDKFKSSARLMKLKINIKQSPMKKDTLIRLQGSKKQIRDFDAVVRGKSSYGDPSVVEDAVERAKEMADLKAKHKREAEQEKDEIQRTKDTATEDVLAQLNSLEEQLDLLEKQYAVKGGETDFSKRNRLRRTKSSSGKYMSKDDIVAKLKKLPDGKNKVKDSNNSLIVRSLARLMNTERRPAAKKGAALGKGKPVDEMDAPQIKKIIDIVSKGMSITKTGNKFMRNKKELDAFSDLDTYTRDEVADIILKASDGILYSLVYEGTELNEESATMKKVRQVVKKKGMMNIDGMKLDLTTASMISSVYDKVNSQNKKRMDKLKLPQLVNLTMKVAGKTRKESTDLQEQQAMLKRVKERFPRLGKAEQEKISMIVKPKGQIDSKLFVDLGNAYDKRDLKTLKKLMTNYAKKYKIEAVSPAQQAAIAISKKERGEKPKNECVDEKDFKPHKMYKGDKEVMANTYADHVKYDKMGYTHEKPKKEALDAKDKPFVKDLVKKLRGGSKTHAKQADDLEKAMNTESMSRARRDAMRDMGTRKDRDDDGNPVATADDRKAADKNVVMQIRRVTDLSKPAQIELRNGKKVMLKPADAKMMMKKFDAIRKPQDRLKVQTAMNDKKMTVQGLKRLLGK